MADQNWGQWPMRRYRSDLDTGSVHVWFTPLDLPDAVVELLFRTLSSEEQERSGRFQFARDRRRSIVAWAGLRNIVGMYLGGNPRRFCFRRGSFGKPALAGEHSDIRFNMAHSGGGVLYAFARGREVGVDLEIARPLSDMMSLAEACFCKAEISALRALPDEERLQGFFRGWTRKEAFLKASGRGLSLALQSFEVSLAPGAGRQALNVHDTQYAGREWTLVSLPPPRPGYSGALVVEGRDCRITCSEWVADRQRPGIAYLSSRMRSRARAVEPSPVQTEWMFCQGQTRTGVN